MRKKISIILPTYNERENIEELINQIMRAVKEDYEIVVIDDDSPDKTWKAVKGIAAANKNIRLIRRIGERGLASAIARGIDESTGDVVVWMDCDLSMPPAVIPRLLEHIPSFDVVVGSRYAAGGKDARKMLRVITSRMINLYASLLLSFKVKDFDSGFIAAKKSVFRKVKIKTQGYGQYCIRFLYDCLRQGYKVKEVGYCFTDREKGVSKSGETLLQLAYHGWNYGLEVLKLRLGR